MATINDYINEIQKAENKMFDALGYTIGRPVIDFTEGKKFYKITRNSGQLSVHCFVDKETGDIYKASGWNAPAKGIRGNINNVNKPLLSRDFYK